MNESKLDTVLLDFQGSTTNDNWTIRNAMEGVQIFGGIGSGKSSGSAQTIAKKFLTAKFGGIVLTVKASERKDWEQYCRDTGRSNDLIIIEPRGKNFFNFLEYESRYAHSGSSITENIVHVLKTVINAGNEKDSGKSNDAFWDNALDVLLSNVIDLNKLAYNEVKIQTIYELVQSIPKSGEAPSSEKGETAFTKALELARNNVTKKLDEWEASLDSSVLNTYIKNKIYDDEAAKAIPEFRLLKIVDEFFSDNFINLSEKTRSIIEFSFTSFLFRLLREPVYTLFCNSPTNVTPDDCAKGKIILIDLPVKTYDKVGRDIQILWKYCFQRAMERRTITPTSRPVFLFADESQNFIHEYDADYQATARSSRISTVYITQCISNYYANMGGHKSDAKVKAFLATLNTQIFHASSDIETNRYASERIGDAYYEKHTQGKSVGVGNISQSENVSTELKRLVRPEAFVGLLTGGHENNFIVEAYLHRQGKPFSTGLNVIKMKFRQQ